MDVDEEDDVRSRMKGARTARGSTWNHTKVFSEAGSEGAHTKAGRAPSKRSGPAAGPRGHLRSGQSTKQVSQSVSQSVKYTFLSLLGLVGHLTLTVRYDGC